MVSFPDDIGMSSSGSHRRAPSVASTTRSSTTLRPSRHHRHQYAKSHAGVTNASSTSSGHGVTNEFPNFERTGDVEIVLVSGRKEARYLLHTLYLAQCSGWFEDVLGLGDAGGSEVSAGSTSSARTSPTTGRKVRFELEKGRTNEPMPMLIAKVCDFHIPMHFPCAFPCDSLCRISRPRCFPHAIE